MKHREEERDRALQLNPLSADRARQRYSSIVSARTEPDSALHLNHPSALVL